MSGKPLVPSKDALRALRCLAYSPPAAFVGAAGALCGVATVHYHARQKVRRAEEILETKRKLHTITKGRGSARLACMFEAAEKGEDFTIHRGRSPRSPGRRHHSVFTARQESDDTANWKPFSHTVHIETAQREAEGPYEVAPALEDSWNPNQTCVPLKADNETLDSYKRDPHEEKPSILGIYRNSDQSRVGRRTKEYQSWGKMMPHAHQHVRRMPLQAQQILESPKEWTPFNSLINVLADQPLTDLNPIEGILLTQESVLQSRPQADKIELGSILLNIDPSQSFARNSLSSLQPWQSTSDGAELKENSSENLTQLSDKPARVNLYLTSSTNVPHSEIHHPFQSRYNFKNLRMRKGMSVVGVDRYEYVFTCLMNFRQRYGKQEALSLLERTMELYTVTDKRSDFALAQALFLDCTRHFSTKDLKPLTYRYVERFLRGDTPRLEVVSFLYPRCGAGEVSRGQHYYFLAHQYLENIREKGYTLDRQVTELRKILAGTHMCSIEVHEHLVLPVLKALCSAGRMTSAQALYDEMVSSHKLNFTFYSLQVLVKGYARSGNWFKVKCILDECHAKGLSREKIYGVSGLLISVINEYALSFSPERVVQFVMHSIRQYGIQPVSHMTREVISLCLRHHRYDLVVNWINMVRTEYPHVEVGTNSSPFAFDIACVWKDVDASCEDILQGCRAIATHALRDPFSKVFRASLSDAVIRYMAPRLQELRAELGPEVPDVPTGEIHEYHAALKRLKDKMATKSHGSRARLLLADLLNQGQALRWLNALCRGHLQSQGVVSRSVRLTDTPQASKSHTRLPVFPDLQDTLLKHYVQRDKANQNIEHERLREVVAELKREGREFHAFELIQSIYDSRWAQPTTGLEFDLDLFTTWVKLAWDLRSGTKLRSVLWALVDASPQLHLNSQILLLARIAAPKTHMQKVKHARTYEVDEVEYLRLRLRRRHWTSSPSKDRLSFDEWQGLGRPGDEYDIE